MEKELVDIVLQKSFIELSKEDRIALSEWCTSEEEYDQMKNVFVEVERMKLNQIASVRPQTKKSLDVLFMEKHQKAPVFWNKSVLTILYPVDKPLHRRPLMQVAALVLLLLLAYPMIKGDRLYVPSEQTAQNDKGNNYQESINSTLKDSVTTPAIRKEKKVIHSKAPVLVASNELLKEKSAIESVWSSTGAAAPFSSDVPVVEIADASFINHPDGVFDGETISAFSEPVSEDPGILDLLTVAF